MLVQLVFAVSLGWLPVGGRFPPSLLPPEGSGFFLLDSALQNNWTAFRGTVRHLILPAGTLALLWSVVERPRWSAAWGLLAVLFSHRWLLALHPLTWMGVPAWLSLPVALALWLACGSLAALLLALSLIHI